VPKTGKKRKNASSKKTRKTKKWSSAEMGQALLLTAAIIAVSVIIAIVILRVAATTTEAPATITETPAPPPEVAATTEAKTTPAPKAPEVAATKTPPPKTTPAPKVTPAPKAPPELPPPHRGTLVFIIDDAGNSLQELEPFLRFPGPLTIAVLPGLPHSVESARRIRAAGKEVLLHQPMEAVNGPAPGPGALYAGMNAHAILAILNKNIAEIGPVAGMNNHQGSKITADQQMMETVLRFCREQGIHFMDSRTTAHTTAPAIAQRLGMKIGERNIFIDNEQSRSAMDRAIKDGLALAVRNGSAVMIGHAWSPELAPLLTSLYENLIAQGYTFSTVSALLSR